MVRRLPSVFVRRLAPLAPLALLGLSPACSEPACPALEACDIREQDCQRRTRRVLACLRGSEGPAPEIVVVDAEAFIEGELRDVESTPEPAEARDLRRGLSLFGLMADTAAPAAVTREYWSNVAAFFSGDEGRVTILDRGEPLDEPESVTLLLHELVHAAQAAELAALPDHPCCDSHDEVLAYRGILEGEAELYEDLATVYGYGGDPAELDWDEVFDYFQGAAWTAMRATPNPFELATLYFPYAFGGRFVNDAYRTRGNSEVRALLRETPGSTREILYGYGAPAPPGGFVENPDELGHPELPADFEHLATLRLGAFLYEAFESAWRAGGFGDSGFAGDVLSLFVSSESSAVLGTWRLRFTSAARAQAVATRLDREALATRVDERDLIVMASSEPALARSLLPELVFVPVPAPEPEAEPAPAPSRTACFRP